MQFKIEGIMCEGCINRIKNVLENTKGIDEFDISLDDKILKIKVKNDKILKNVIDKIENLGFEIQKIL